MRATEKHYGGVEPVEPLYLQAETAACPELRLVAVMHGDKLSYAQTFDAAAPGEGRFSDAVEALCPQQEPLSRFKIEGDKVTGWNT